MKPKHADDGMYCPHFRAKCVKVCHTCEMWEPFEGKHAQTGADLSGWKCSLKMQALIGLDHSRIAHRQTEVLAETIDKVSAAVGTLQQKVAESHDVAMVGAIQRLNRQFDAAQTAIANGNNPAQKLIEG